MSVESTGDEIPSYINIKIKTLRENLKAGSYVPLEIELENTKDFYIATTLYITKAPKEIQDNTNTRITNVLNVIQWGKLKKI